MGWFLYDNSLRHERVKHFCLSDKKNGDKIGDVTAFHNDKPKTSEGSNIDNNRYNKIQK